MREPRTAVLAGAVACAALAACTQAPQKPSSDDTRAGLRGRVEAQDLAEPDAQRYSAEGNVKYVQALGYPENAMPGYPSELLASRLPEVTLRVRLVVDAAGNVTDVTRLDDVADAGAAARFFASVRDACLGWKYSPLLRLDLAAGPTTVEDGEGSVTYEGRPTALPFHRDYVFRFTQHDGKAEVGTSDADSVGH